MAVSHLHPRKIAARYIGDHPLTLPKEFAPYRDGDGKALSTLSLYPGDTLMMPETEVLGQTFLEDPRAERDTLWLGPGRVILPADQDKSPEELGQIGYSFHEGRPDFEPVGTGVPPEEPPPGHTAPLPPVGAEQEPGGTDDGERGE